MKINEQQIESWINKWIAINCESHSDAIYGNCVELCEDLYNYLKSNGENVEIWELWSLNDDNLSQKLPLVVNNELQTEIKNLKMIYKMPINLTDIGYGIHHIVKWNGYFWDGKGKRFNEIEIINDFNTENENMHLFRTL